MDGSELVDIKQVQNGNQALCSAPISSLGQAILSVLPTTLPSQSGVLWNNGGMICIS